MKSAACPVCNTFPYNGEAECRECGANLPPRIHVPLPVPAPSHDDVKPQPGRLSELYDIWLNKRVRRKLREGESAKAIRPVGTVVGTDSCHADTNKDGEYLIVRPDVEPPVGSKYSYIPLSEIEEVT